MTTPPQYELLKASITDDDCQRAFEVLLPHIGYANRIAIDEIAWMLYRSRGDNAVRKSRDVVELLRTQYGVAVCSSSGRAGRWLAESEAEKRECLADFYSRLDSLKAVIAALEKAKVPPPEVVTRKVQPVQVGLW